MKVINFYGGPNTGKSTKAAGMYYKMNLADYVHFKTNLLMMKSMKKLR